MAKLNRVMVNLPDEMYIALKDTSKEYNVSLSALINMLIAEALKSGIKLLDSASKIA